MEANKRYQFPTPTAPQPPPEPGSQPHPPATLKAPSPHPTPPAPPIPQDLPGEVDEDQPSEHGLSQDDGPPSGPNSLGEIREVAIEDIHRPRQIQMREKLNADTVTEYAEAMESGARFPPVTVFHDDDDRSWLADGFHRVAAAEAAGVKSFMADIRPGSKREAEEFALGANANHGLKRSNADKRKAVTKALNDGEWGELSDRRIAAMCAVSNTFVGNVRKELEAADRPDAAHDAEQEDATTAEDMDCPAGAEGDTDTGIETAVPAACDEASGSHVDTHNANAASNVRAQGNEAPAAPPAPASPDSALPDPLILHAALVKAYAVLTEDPDRPASVCADLIREHFDKEYPGLHTAIRAWSAPSGSRNPAAQAGPKRVSPELNI